MHWILIIWLGAGFTNYASIDHVSFNDERACEAALAKWGGKGFCTSEQSP